MKTIPIAQPAFLGNEHRYVHDCMESQWISSIGKYINEFETHFASWCGTRFAVSCCNGTAALHVALMALGVKPGDEILVPTLTFVATVNAVTMCGATPVFVDSEKQTWNIDPASLEKHITSKTTGIIPVHLYGYPADMEKINVLAKKHNLFVLEDAAEAHGAEVKGKRVGSLSKAGVFSFFGNKILTTGEGGMVTTDDEALMNQLKLIRSQGQDPNRRYWFPVIGYNYRMTNIAAAIGLAQLEKVDEHLMRRSQIDRWYRKHLHGLEGVILQKILGWAKPVNWLFTICVDSTWPHRDVLMAELAKKGIETRPIFYPIHTLPPYAHPHRSFKVAESIASSGMNLPTWVGMDEDAVVQVCAALKSLRQLRIAA